MLTKIIFLLLIHFSSQAMAVGVLYRPATSTLESKGLEAEAELRRFSTTAYYDLDGGKFEMDEGDTFTLTDINLNIRYGYGVQLELRGGLRLRQVESDSETETLSNTGLESATLGLKYSFLKSGPFRYALDAQVRNTFYTNDLYEQNEVIPEGEIVLGDSGTSFLLGGHLSFDRPGSYVLSTSLFYHRAPSNLSDEIVYEALAYVPFSRLGLGVGLSGISSLNQDEFSEDPAQKPRKATGVTSLFNSINRSHTKLFARGAYAFDSFTFNIEGGRIMKGSGTDEGNEIAFSIVWTKPGVTTSQMKVESFKEYDVEASVIRVSPRGKFIKIDKGMADDLKKGMRVDIYQTDFFGGNQLVASGVVFEVASDSAIVRLEKTFGNTEIKNGFTARAR